MCHQMHQAVCSAASLNGGVKKPHRCCPGTVALCHILVIKSWRTCLLASFLSSILFTRLCKKSRKQLKSKRINFDSSPWWSLLCRKLPKTISLVFLKTPTCVPYMTSARQSCQEISSWLIVFLAKPPWFRIGPEKRNQRCPWHPWQVVFAGNGVDLFA